MLGNIPILVIPIPLGNDPSATYDLEAEYIVQNLKAEYITYNLEAEVI